VNTSQLFSKSVMKLSRPATSLACAPKKNLRRAFELGNLISEFMIFGRDYDGLFGGLEDLVDRLGLALGGD